MVIENLTVTSTNSNTLKKNSYHKANSLLAAAVIIVKDQYITRILETVPYTAEQSYR